MREKGDTVMTASLGSLYVCATPIGNLQDITLRALEVLRRVDIIACEDTRRTRKLTSHFEVKARLMSYHKFNKESKGAQIYDIMRQGKDVALVSDAGSPAISDPGYELVKGAWEQGLTVVSVPGPSALTAALGVAGLDTSSFLFLGFLPRSSSKRQEALVQALDVGVTLAFYEAPHRILACLNDIKAVAPTITVAACRELTKKHEEVHRGTPEVVGEDLRQRFGQRPQGEFTVIVAPLATGTKGDGVDPTGSAEGGPRAAGLREMPTGSIVERLAELVGAGISRKDAVKQVADERGLPKQEVYVLGTHFRSRIDGV